MESKKDLGLLIRMIGSATGLNQKEIASRINYSRESLSRAKKSGDEAIYNMLEREFAKELATQQEGKMNPEIALVLAMLDDYAEFKSKNEDVPYESVKAEIQRKARLILGGLDSWLPE